jgi:hypothetical protein
MIKRGKGKIEVHHSRQDMYKHYLRKVEGRPDRFQLSYPEYHKILNSFNKQISEAILKENYEFTMPHKLGVMRIRKYKPILKIDKETGELKKKGLAPDWQATRELWKINETAKEESKVVYHINDHSDGYQYNWYYSTYRSNMVNKSLYRFIPSRTNKRELARLIKDPNFKGDYFE